MAGSKDVLQPSSQDIYVVELQTGSEAMIPVVSQFVREVNPEEGYVKVRHRGNDRVAKINMQHAVSEMFTAVTREASWDAQRRRDC